MPVLCFFQPVLMLLPVLIFFFCSPIPWLLTDLFFRLSSLCLLHFLKEEYKGASIKDVRAKGGRGGQPKADTCGRGGGGGGGSEANADASANRISNGKFPIFHRIFSFSHN